MRRRWLYIAFVISIGITAASMVARLAVSPARPSLPVSERLAVRFLGYTNKVFGYTNEQAVFGYTNERAVLELSNRSSEDVMLCYRVRFCVKNPTNGLTYPFTGWMSSYSTLLRAGASQRTLVDHPGHGLYWRGSVGESSFREWKRDVRVRSTWLFRHCPAWAQKVYPEERIAYGATEWIAP